MNDSIYQPLTDKVRGPVFRPGDDAYDEVRVIHNGMIDKRPGLLVRCSGVADVIDCVNFARDNNILFSVRGGGHNPAGNCLCDDGITIDLSTMRGVRVDPDARIAWVQGGATLGDIDRETQAFALVAPSGVVSETGIAGLTLGGGFGWVRGKHGMSIDNLLSVDIVTADGKFLHASENENEDLFWAVRGGGGNFGIVTSFEFQLHPLGPIVMHCAPIYHGDQAKEITKAWREFMHTAPDEFTTELFYWNIPVHPTFPEELHGTPVVVPAGVWAGNVEEGEKFVQPLRELGTPLLDISGPKPFTVIQKTFDPYLPKGELQNYWKSIYLDNINDEVIDLVIEIYESRPAQLCPFVMHDLRGASSRVAADATAFGDRSAPFLFELNSSWTDLSQSESNIAWTRQKWDELRKFSSGGLYLNFAGLGMEDQALVRETYGDNYDRLVEIKNKYDPANLFRLNQNIVPTV
jgi:FAD/FMN-containing dehydrogenase